MGHALTRARNALLVSGGGRGRASLVGLGVNTIAGSGMRTCSNNEGGLLLLFRIVHNTSISQLTEQIIVVRLGRLHLVIADVTDPEVWGHCYARVRT